MRQDYNYEGLKMELDETTYEWGTCYEIEIETVSVVLKTVIKQSFCMNHDKLQDMLHAVLT